mgnify:FL=1
MTETFYSQWRLAGTIAAVRDAVTEPPPERLLQALWQRQRLQRDSLRTLDGRSVRVLHPGFWNHEAGPDFRDAVIQIANAAPISGAVEVDSVSADWRAHGHAVNPAFAEVILHVIWNGPAHTALPTLLLQPHLDAPWPELAEELAGHTQLPVEFAGQCRAPLAAMLTAEQNALLDQAAGVRLRIKAKTMERHARRHGWDAALWHGLFRALGYKHNVWPMQHLAEQLPFLQALGTTDATGWQARLLGAAGLLTDDLRGQTDAAQEWLQTLWHHWWREREALEEITLPRTAWRLGGLRPANHPIRRLVLLAHWLARGDLVDRLENWMTIECSRTQLGVTLGERLIVQPVSFWKWHWTFRSPRQKRRCSLLGSARVTDLAVNVILPWFYARCQVGRNQLELERVEARYRQWPSAQDNAVLKLARQRLFGGPRRLQGAAQQQGVLQIVRDFCDHAPATCEDCSFPDLVQSWPDQRGGEPDS